MQKSLPPNRLWDFTSIPFELFILTFSLVPILFLMYFYPALPERIPVFLNLKGEVVGWAEKSWLSVLRVPLMALDTQLICLLMKYGTVQSVSTSSKEISQAQSNFEKQFASLNARLWDWFRALVAFKMSASSLDTIFLSLDKFRFLSRPAFLVTAVAALLSIPGVLFFGYRILVLTRNYKQSTGTTPIRTPIDPEHVYGRILYVHPADPALFVRKYGFNFGNKWAWIFVAGMLAYPVLVFSVE
ncbi:MAG TPA: DUF1648 domain-containing protein [Pyrinomonadaceae bacterium]|nr:DUF1648 domain-containing protein [Pyrinomonadaceae bacterium]